MQRINPDAATVEEQQFTEGSPEQGVPATVVTAQWLNGVQEELVKIIEDAGLELDSEDATQLAAAIFQSPHIWPKAQRYAQTELGIDTGAVAWDMEANPHAVLVLDDDVTTFTVSNYKSGGTYELTVIQDAAGGWACATPTNFRTPGGVALEFTQDANGEDLVNVSVRDESGTLKLRAYMGQDFKAVA